MTAPIVTEVLVNFGTFLLLGGVDGVIIGREYLLALRFLDPAAHNGSDYTKKRTPMVLECVIVKPIRTVSVTYRFCLE